MVPRTRRPPPQPPCRSTSGHPLSWRTPRASSATVCESASTSVERARELCPERCCGDGSQYRYIACQCAWRCAAPKAARRLPQPRRARTQRRYACGVRVAHDSQQRYSCKVTASSATVSNITSSEAPRLASMVKRLTHDETKQVRSATKSCSPSAAKACSQTPRFSAPHPCKVPQPERTWATLDGGFRPCDRHASCKSPQRR